MNEGWATFWHYTILNHLYDEGLLSDKFMLEFLHSHTSVVAQPPYNSRYFSGINPYALGFAMFRDIKRICEEPTEEDKEWFPELAGANWLDALHFAMRNFKDESFISQYLSPKLIRDFKFFAICDDDRKITLKSVLFTMISDINKSARNSRRNTISVILNPTFKCIALMFEATVR